jgi:lipoprotein-anchoring transpeptidase ErfK/SrfK
MNRLRLAFAAAALLAMGGPAFPAALTADAVNDAPRPAKPSKSIQPGLIRAQVLLDRARFSPGEIDGRSGDNMQRALGAFAAAIGQPPPGDQIPQPVWDALLARAPGPVLVEHKLTRDDVRGPFVRRIPPKLEEMTKLKRLGYRNVADKLGEQFHVSPILLKALNPGKRLDRPGVVLTVPDVSRPNPERKVARIEVDKINRVLRAWDETAALVATYPASIGSEEKPAPSGHFEVAAIAPRPTYTYNPEYAFKGVKTDRPFTIAAGPNNPVGSVWIDLTAQSYGIHGTPEPSRIGKAASHGCVRLTNWDVQDLAKMVRKGVGVDFLEGPAFTAAAQPADTAASGASGAKAKK